jgi:hypothetical protein
MKDNVAAPRRRGRPSKFGRPSQLFALTLPIDVVRGLRRVDRDLARAIVRLFEGATNSGDEISENEQPDTELLQIADRRSLIVVKSAVIRSLPGVSIVPLDGTRAFLALEPGRGISDLELAVIDRLDDAVQARERQALEQLREQLRTWRRDPSLQFHGRAIIVVETLAPSRTRGDATSARAAARKRNTHRAAARPTPQRPVFSDTEDRGPRASRAPSVH